jgi:hypothetical protein
MSQLAKPYLLDTTFVFTDELPGDVV